MGSWSGPSWEASNSIDGTLYPELVASGGLGNALQRALDHVPGALRTSDLNEPGFLAYASVRFGTRSSQVMIAARHRAFSVDFWSMGVKYGHAWVGDLAQAAFAIAAFLVDRSSLLEMRASVPRFVADERAEAHERGSKVFVSEAWIGLHRWLAKEKPGSAMGELLPLVEEAGSRPELRALMPFTSLNRLCFSRVTGFPYTRDCPMAWPVGGGVFRAVAHPTFLEESDVPDVLGEGEARAVTELIVAGLPVGCGPARHGTAEDET